MNGAICIWNEAAEALYGYTRAEAIGRSVQLIIPEDLRVTAEEVFVRLRQGVNFPPLRTRRRHKDGHEIHVRITYQAITNGRGTIAGVVAYYEELTEMHGLETELHRAKEFLRTYMAALPEACLITSVTGVVIAMDERVRQMFCLPEQDWVDRSVLDVRAAVGVEFLNSQAAWENAEMSMTEQEPNEFILRLTDGRIILRNYCAVKTRDGQAYAHLWRFREI